jgi:hypothetical protein
MSKPFLQAPRAGVNVVIISLRGDDAQPDDDHERLKANIDEDLAALAANPSHVSVRFRFMAGRWPMPHEIERLRQRQLDDPNLRLRSFVDVLPELIAAGTRGAN